MKLLVGTAFLIPILIGIAINSQWFDLLLHQFNHQVIIDRISEVRIEDALGYSLCFFFSIFITSVISLVLLVYRLISEKEKNTIHFEVSWENQHLFIAFEKEKTVEEVKSAVGARFPTTDMNEYTLGWKTSEGEWNPLEETKSLAENGLSINNTSAERPYFLGLFRKTKTTFELISSSAKKGFYCLPLDLPQGVVPIEGFSILANSSMISAKENN